MQIYICDDEVKILSGLSEKVKQHMSESHIATFSSGEALLQQLQGENCDILLLDIDMPELSGMDIAGKLSELPQGPLLVFVTSHDELVYEIFQYHPFSFVRKNFFDEEIGKVLEDCKRELKERKKDFHFKMSGRNVILPLAEILYFEADGNYLKLYTKEETYRFRSTVAEVENRLLDSGFVRSHKGFLVNQSAVRIIDRDALKIINGDMVPIGKSYAESVKSQMLRYMRL